MFWTQSWSVLLSTACPTSLASEPNIRGGRSGVQMAPAYGVAFGGIDNDQPEIKARQRHRARLDPKPRYPSKDFHHKEIAKKLRGGFRGLRKILHSGFGGASQSRIALPTPLNNHKGNNAALPTRTKQQHIAKKLSAFEGDEICLISTRTLYPRTPSDSGSPHLFVTTVGTPTYDNSGQQNIIREN